MKFIVVGCGRVGRDLSLALVRQGHNVAVVDSDPEAFEKLGPRFPGQTIFGVVFDREVLVQAGIERADGLAAVTNSDNANIVTARIARNIYRVPQVVARLYEPSRAEVYRKLGLQTISSTSWGVNRIMQLLARSRLEPTMEMGSGEVAIYEVEVGPHLEGRTAQHLNITTEVKVFAIIRNGKAFIPSTSTPFVLGDRITVAVAKSAQERFESMVGW